MELLLFLYPPVSVSQGVYPIIEDVSFVVKSRECCFVELHRMNLMFICSKEVHGLHLGLSSKQTLSI